MATNKETKVGTTITTEGIVKAIAEKTNGTEVQLSQKQAQAALAALKDVVSDAIAEGQKVQLTGFVTFEPSYRAARQGNNIKTGEKQDIPESAALNAKAGKQLKDITKGYSDKMIAALKAAKAN